MTGTPEGCNLVRNRRTEGRAIADTIGDIDADGIATHFEQVDFHRFGTRFVVRVIVLDDRESGRIDFASHSDSFIK